MASEGTVNKKTIGLAKYLQSTSYLKIKKLLKSNSRTLLYVKILVVYLIILQATWHKLDPDFGWHLVVGDYIRLHGVPMHDIYSYTTHGASWIDHEWLNNVLVSWLYQWGGYGLLSVAFAGLWTASLCLFRKRIRFVVLILAVLAVMPYLGVRTTVWGVLGVAILIELLERRSRKALALIPFLFLLWANLHGSFVLGFAIVGYYALMRRQIRYMYLLFICVVATFINPYGPRVYAAISNILFDPAVHGQITEWRSFWLQSPTWPFIILWGVSFWLFAKNKLSNWWSLSPIMLLASLSASRYLPIFVIVALRDIDKYSPLYKLPKNLDRPRKIVITIFLFALVCVMGYLFHTTYYPYNREAAYPKQAVNYLRSHGCSGNLYNDYDYGGYLIWKLPSTPVYIDGRMPTWRYPSGESHMTRYYELLANPAVQKAEFKRYNIRCALLRAAPINKKLKETLTRAGWKPVARGNGSVLFFSP